MNALFELSNEMAAEIRLEALFPVIIQKTTEILEADRRRLRRQVRSTTTAAAAAAS